MRPPSLPQGGTPYDSLLRQALARWFTAFELWIGPRTPQVRSSTQGGLVNYAQGVEAVAIGSGAAYFPVAGWGTQILWGTNGSRIQLQSGTPATVRAALQADPTAVYLDYWNGPLMIRRGPTSIESARFDPSGRFMLNGTPGGWTARQTLGYAIGVEEGLSLNATGTFATCYSGVFRINGTVAGTIYHTTASATIYSTTSDRRLKTAIVDAPPALGLLERLRVRSFDWRTDGSHVSHSFVAQELEEVYPLAVSKGSGDGAGDDLAEGAMPWGMDASALVPLLVKALQEQQQQIAALQAAVGIKG